MLRDLSYDEVRDYVGRFLKEKKISHDEYKMIYDYMEKSNSKHPIKIKLCTMKSNCYINIYEYDADIWKYLLVERVRIRAL